MKYADKPQILSQSPEICDEDSLLAGHHINDPWGAADKASMIFMTIV